MLLYLIKELSIDLKLFNSKITIIFAILLIINISITYKYIQIKSSYNTATYNLYRLTSDSMGQIRKIAFEDTEKLEDIFVLHQVIEDIYLHTKLLLGQMEHTMLASRNQHIQLYTTIHDLSEQLELFLNQHNGILAKGEKIEAHKFKYYDDLKLKLLYFAHNFIIRGSSSGVRFGIMQYQLSLDELGLSNLQATVSEISEIVVYLTSESK